MAVFGVPLVQLLERERRPSNIPQILEKSVAQLRASDPTFNTEGIFRITGDITVINQLKDLLDSCMCASRIGLDWIGSDRIDCSVQSVSNTLIHSR
jgi:hypothetical protein